MSSNGDSIWLWGGDHNTVSSNVISESGRGILVWRSNYNQIHQNYVKNNYRGVEVESSANNSIYHNNFINNFYVDWWGPWAVDLKRGPYQNETGSDGIWDLLYFFGGVYDRYPLVNPWGTGVPTANFSWSPSIPEVNELVTFDASASMPMGGEIVSYEWEFGDGSRASGKIVTHRYAAIGTFIVTLNVTDSEDLWDIEQKQIEVKAPPPPLTVTISPMSASILVGQLVTFTSTVSGGYPPYTYQWFLNGNPVSGATSNTWTFTPTTSGIFYVYLKVTDVKGNTAQSDAARIAVATVPVGGYSIPIQTPTKTEPILPYIALITTLTITMTKIRNKTKRRR
jgi:parallel beta-helix repeat protein